MEQYIDYNRSYLYNCNMNRDIENNMGEVIAPEFTMKHVIDLDEKYKKTFMYVSRLTNRIQKYNLIVEDINYVTNELTLNELFMEHRHNIEIMINNVNKYNEYNRMEHELKLNDSLTVKERTNDYMVIRSKKIRIYFEDILPLIKSDEENLNMVMGIMNNMKYYNV
jgi:hypothetical protein